MQMPVAVESVGDSEGQSESQFVVSENTPLGTFALSSVRLSNTDREAEKALSGS